MPCCSVYGFAVVGASWNDLTHELRRAIEYLLFRTIDGMSFQEAANLMYGPS